MNNKGFTLVEILSVIVLISLLLGIGIPGISRISQNMKVKAMEKKIELVEQAGILWGQDNKAMLQSNECFIDDAGTVASCKQVSISKLIDEDYLDSEDYNSIIYKNPSNNKNLAELACNEKSDNSIDKDINDCCVHIYKKNNRVYAYFGDKSCQSGLIVSK